MRAVVAVAVLALAGCTVEYGTKPLEQMDEVERREAYACRVQAESAGWSARAALGEFGRQRAEPRVYENCMRSKGYEPRP